MSTRRLFISLLFLFHSGCSAQVVRKRTTLLMGGRFDISVVAKNARTADENIDTIIKEISRIEYLISDWKEHTQIAEVNRNAGIRPVKVDKEVFDLTKRALFLSELTDGAFDISFAAMDRIWKFDGSMIRMPDAEAIRKSVEKVGYKRIVLDSIHSTIFLSATGMKIGFGALGEGYAADKCRDMMLKRGIKAGIVNASGDISTWGKQPDGKPWLIGITHPFHKDSLFAYVPLSKGAIVTSGNYEKFVVFNGQRYSHIINPVTGYPATGITSVTVLGPQAELANGFSTSIMVLGKEKGLEMIARFPEYSCLIFADNGEIFLSPNLAPETLAGWRMHKP